VGFSFVQRQWIGLLSVVVGLAGSAAAQSVPEMHAAPVVAMSMSEPADLSNLPDAPAPAAAHSTDTPEPATQMETVPSAQRLPQVRIAPRYDLYIQQGMTSQTLNGSQKFALASLQIVNGNIFITGLVSAGWSQLLNSNPKYGTDRGAFGERYGAAILRESSQSIFASGFGAVIFHDDPRYYILGDGHSIARRAWYAATRVVVTRTDTGTERWNAPLLLGYIVAAALTQTYYPSTSKGAVAVATTYGASLGGSALGFGYHEILGDVLRVTHLKKSQAE
jgi:hypothetical protein